MFCAIDVTHRPRKIPVFAVVGHMNKEKVKNLAVLATVDGNFSSKQIFKPIFVSLFNIQTSFLIISVDILHMFYSFI